MYVTFSHFPQSTAKCSFDRFSVIYKWSNFSVFFTLFLPDTKLGRSGNWILATQWRWIHPTHCVTSFFHTLYLRRAQCSLALGSSHHQFNKSDQQNHFHPWLPYFWTLRTTAEVCVVSPFCIGNTWWSFNVRIESLSGTVKTAVCDAARVCAVMMNGCLVCWFYGVLVVRFSVAAGRQLEGANRGDVQLPVVTLSASHPAHLWTWESHKEPLARRTQSF